MAECRCVWGLQSFVDTVSLDSGHVGKEDFPPCSACSKFCLGKTWMGPGGCRAANIWCLGTSECKTRISTGPAGDGASPLQKSPVHGKGFTVNPGPQPVNPIFYNLGLFYIIPKLGISGTKSARSRVN